MLTEEQREQIRKNREKALEIKRKKSEQRGEGERVQKRLKGTLGDSKVGVTIGRPRKEIAEKNLILEAFEQGASELVTKKEAMKMYCLPEGTLAVCSYEEKINPRHKSWTPMKLYRRSEIRARAWERYGGLEGLVVEREKRKEKRFQDDLKRTKNIFKS